MTRIPPTVRFDLPAVIIFLASLFTTGWITIQTCHAQSDAVRNPDQTNKGSVSNIDFEKTPRVKWKYTCERCWFGGSAVHDGVVAVIERTEGQVIGLDASSGEPIWKHPVGPAFNAGGGIVMTCDPKFDAVIIGCDTGLLAVKRKSGELIWERQLGTGVGGPTITSDTVMAGGSDGIVYALDLTTGDEKWTHDYMHDAPKDPAGFDGKRARIGDRRSRPMQASTDGQAVFLSIFDQCRTLAIDAKTGRRIWDFQSEGWMRSRPTIADNMVFVASQDKHFYALDKRTGKPIWDIETGQWNSGSAAIADDLLVFASNDGKVYSVLRSMGSVAWEFDVTNHGTRKGAIYSQPLISNGSVYQAAMNGTLHAIDLDSGIEKWQFEPLPGSELTGETLFDQGVMFLTSRQGRSETGEKAGEAAVIAIEKSDSK